MTVRAMILPDVQAIRDALQDGQELSLKQRVALSAIVQEWLAAPDMAEALALARHFFNETMKQMNVRQSALSGEDIATWNEATIAVNRVCSTLGITAKAGGQ